MMTEFSVLGDYFGDSHRLTKSIVVLDPTKNCRSISSQDLLLCFAERTSYPCLDMF